MYSCTAPPLLYFTPEPTPPGAPHDRHPHLPSSYHPATEAHPAFCHQQRKCGARHLVSIPEYRKWRPYRVNQSTTQRTPKSSPLHQKTRHLTKRPNRRCTPQPPQRCSHRFQSPRLHLHLTGICPRRSATRRILRSENKRRTTSMVPQRRHQRSDPLPSLRRAP